MEFPFKKIILSESETTELAQHFVDQITKGDVIVLNGNLGTGKTFFVKKALEKFEIKNVNSPTFAIVNEYKNSLKFFHFDFYRINKIQELFDIGFNDYLNDEEAVIFIEWGELFQEILPKKKIEINITLNEDFSREFSFIKYE